MSKFKVKDGYKSSETPFNSVNRVPTGPTRLNHNGNFQVRDKENSNLYGKNFLNGNGYTKSYFHRSNDRPQNNYFNKSNGLPLEPTSSAPNDHDGTSYFEKRSNSSTHNNWTSQDKSIVSKTWGTPLTPKLTSDGTLPWNYFVDGNYQQIPEISLLDQKAYRIERDSKGAESKRYRSSQQHSSITDPRSNKSFNMKKHMYHMKFKKRTVYNSYRFPPIVHDKHFIGSLPPSEIVITGVTQDNENKLRSMIRDYGNISTFLSHKDPENGTDLGIIYVQFDNADPQRDQMSVRRAMDELNRHDFVRGVRVYIERNGEMQSKFIQEELARRLAIIKEMEQKKENQRKERIRLEMIQIEKLRIEQENKEKWKVFDKRMKEITPEKESEPEPPVKDLLERLSPDAKEQKDSNSLFTRNTLKELKSRPYVLLPRSHKPAHVKREHLKSDFASVTTWRRIIEDAQGMVFVFDSNKHASEFYSQSNGLRYKGFNLNLRLSLVEEKTDQKEHTNNNEDKIFIGDAVSSILNELESSLIKDILKSLNTSIIKEFSSNQQEVIKPIIAQSSSNYTESQVPSYHTIEETKPLNFDSFKTLGPVRKRKVEGVEIIRKKKKVKRDLQPLRLVVDEDEDGSQGIDGVGTKTNLELAQEESSSDEEDQIENDNKMDIDAELEKDIQKDTEALLANEDISDVINGNINPEKSTSAQTSNIIIEADQLVVENMTGNDIRPISEEEPSTNHSLFDESHCPSASNEPMIVGGQITKSLNIQNMIELQHQIADEEDFELLKEILSDRTTSISNSDTFIDYTAWKQREQYQDSSITSNLSISEENVLPMELENSTGSHRSQGYNKIPEELKSHYLAHKRRIHEPLKTIQTKEEEEQAALSATTITLTTTTTTTDSSNTTAFNTNQNSTLNETSKGQSSRVNRAQNRRFANEISTFNPDNEALTVNQLIKRRKPVTFARSAIHNWGLYAMEPIQAKEMIIEYVGERIRQAVSEIREKDYLRSGIGSSYLFRIDENTVIDATKKGGIGRFINHCCVPSCTAKIIKVEGKKRIVIYALRDIKKDEELTYDYKFERETNQEERIKCLCGAVGCKGYLN